MREALDAEFAKPETTIASLLDEADAQHKSHRLYRLTRRITGTTHRFWLAMPVLVVVAGLLLAIVAV
jgi:hypothetical protein